MIQIIRSVPTWSTLRNLGQSRLLAYTALVPFLGFVLLFNEQLVDLLSLSPTVAAQLSGSMPDTSAGIAKEITLHRLYLAYFGLSFLGLSSFLYNLLCPIEIKTFSSASEFVNSERPLTTMPRRGLLIGEITNDFIIAQLETKGRLRRGLSDLQYPMQVVSMFSAVFKGIFENSDHPQKRPEGDISAGQSELGVYTALGEVDVFKVAEILMTGRMYLRAFKENFIVAAEPFAVDLLTLRYMGLDHSRAVYRIVISLFYMLGFGILFYPTALTFIQLLWSFF